MSIDENWSRHSQDTVKKAATRPPPCANIIQGELQYRDQLDDLQALTGTYKLTKTDETDGLQMHRTQSVTYLFYLCLRSFFTTKVSSQTSPDQDKYSSRRSSDTGSFEILHVRQPPA